MNDQNWFDYFRDRRFVPVFFITLLTFCLVAALVAAFVKTTDGFDVVQHLPLVLPPFVLFLAIFIWRAVARARARRRDGYERSPLSRDEMRKARSKLDGGTRVNRMNRPAPRPPDTNLKY